MPTHLSPSAEENANNSIAGAPASAGEPAQYRWAAVRGLVPGLVFSLAGMLVSLGIAALIPGVSALLIAILLGVITSNGIIGVSALFRGTGAMPSVLEKGIGFSAKRVLRVGVVLLGLQLSVGQVLSIGPGMIGVVVAVVVIGILSTLVVGKMLGISRSQRLLIACGFSICGAAAVAAVDSVIDDDKEEEVVTAIALVVLFGTLMIPIVPALSGWIGLTETQSGLWAGASIHEVAQVVAAGGAIGATALQLAVIVKLARVLLLAPVMMGISLSRRRENSATGKRVPIMPLFVFGFILMVVVASLGIVPGPVADVAKTAEVACLSAAMFALGTGVRFGMFRRVGPRPLILATVATVVVSTIGLVGVLLAG